MTTLEKLSNYLAACPEVIQCRPEARPRSVELLLEAKAEIERLENENAERQYQCAMLARLASDVPEFSTPLEVYEAQKIRDAILATRKALR